MKSIIIALSLFISSVAFAENYPDITRPAAAEELAPKIITPPADAVAAEPDYSKNPVVHFEEKDWLKIGSVDGPKRDFYVNVKQIDPYAVQQVLVGMVVFQQEQKIAGVGVHVKRIFGEAVVSCDVNTMFPMRDIYTTDDRHIISIQTQQMPHGAMSLNGLSPAITSKICQKKPE